MACEYYLDGKLIGNELQLVDFLLDKYKYYDKFGDKVFQLKPRALEYIRKIEGEIAKDGEEAKRKLNDFMKSKYSGDTPITYDEDGEVLEARPPLMGVNKFISQYKHPDGPNKGKRIVPEYIKEEYWNKRLESWKDEEKRNNGDAYTEDEIQTIRDMEPDFDPTKVYSDDQYKTWSEEIQLRWTKQGEIGSALHAVSLLYFSKNAAGEYIWQVFDRDPGQISKYYGTLFADKMDDYGKIRYGDYVKYEQYKQMIEMCQRLKNQLIKEYGKDAQFYPEFTVTTDTAQKVDGCDLVLGIIDLLVIDEDGKTHIFDYKTSPKAYADYASAKKRGFTLQLSVYGRILQKYGLNTLDGTSLIVPIQLKGFRRLDGSYTFDGIDYRIDTDDRVEVRNIESNYKLERLIDEFLPIPMTLNPKSENLAEKVIAAEEKLFPTYQEMRRKTDEEIDKMLEEAGAYKPTKEGTLRYSFKSGWSHPIEVTVDSGLDSAKVELFKKVKQEISSWTYRKHQLTQSFSAAFNKAVAEGTPFEFEKEGIGTGDSMWLKETMAPYCNGDYEIYEDDNALNFGVIYLQNKRSGAITVLKLSGAKLDYQHEFIKGHTNINGAFEEDVVENSKSDSLMIKATNGNIEAMEAMLVLQNTEFNGPANIMEIKVINPYQQKGMPVSNKELLYSYKNLLTKENFLGEDINKFAGENPSVRMMTEEEKLKCKFLEVMGDTGFSNPETFNDIRTKIEETLNDPINWNKKNAGLLYDKLNDIRIRLEAAYPQLLKVVYRNQNMLNRPENRLYNAIMTTMLELKNINVRQQIEDASNWLQNMNIFKHGWEGLNLENPGNFRSLVLNQLTKSVGNVYQKVKDVLNRENVTVRNLVEELKQLKNFGWVRSNVSNPTEMYRNMTTFTPEGDFLFVKPETLLGAERKFLEHALEIINKNRHPREAESTLKAWKESGDERYYRVPIMAASTGSKLNTTDFLQVTKDRLHSWTLQGALQEMQEKAAGLFIEEDVANSDKPEMMYEMTNRFDVGESDRRFQAISKLRGESGIEHNIETLLLAHTYAYSLKNEMDKEMPLIKASALALSMEGAGANFGTGNFDNLLDFIEKYVKAKVKNQSVNSENLRPWEAAAGKFRKAASFLSLAFSPLQFTYQSLEGIWKACALIIKKPDGTNAFTAKHMWDAFKSAYKDLGHYSDKPSLCLLMNETYGLNDMDANQFAERISSDHSIWTHFTDFAFKFASRADYYNRLTIWGAQMRNDGSWEAHHIDKNGKLVYDCKKDKRYAAFFDESKKGTAEYNEAKSRYLAAAEQFEREGVLNEDGTPFVASATTPPKPLPRAYTNMEAQGMKAIADNMYGYYNHENKSMMNSMFLGSLATQMKTYWSAKKNQYLAPGGVKLVGHWEDYKENDKQMYYAKDESGEIDLSKGLVTEDDPNCSGVKVTKWKGQWQEGVMATFYKFFDKGDKSFSEQWNNLWNNEDPNLQVAYRSNIKHIALDLMFIALGALALGFVLEPWDDELKKEFNKDVGNTTKATEYMMSHFLTQTVDHSFMDFNFFDSIFSPTIDWLPFAFSSAQRVATNAIKVITGDSSVLNAFANTTSLVRQTKPLLKSLTYDEL